MKTFKSLRALIAAGSIAGFLGAWVLLGHASNFAQAQTQPAIASPAPSVGAAPDSSLPPVLQPLPSLPQSGFAIRPRLRTGGS